MGADVARIAGKLIYGGIADRDHPGTASGPLGIEINQPVADRLIPGHIHMHGRHEDAVLDFHAVDGNRLEKRVDHNSLQ
ncbi:MAG: hypothetical protein PVSMB11_11110 [Desulfuromonadaceae bacterium]